MPVSSAIVTNSELKSAANGHDSGATTAHLERLQQTLRRAFKLLVTSGDSNTELLALPLGQVRCLRRIIEQDGCKLVDLARETNLSVPNASRLVDRLVRRGLVVRPTDPADRRAVRLHATPESKAMIASSQEQRLANIARVTRTLSTEQIDHVIETLAEVIAAAEKANCHSVDISSLDDMPAIEIRDLVE